MAENDHGAHNAPDIERRGGYWIVKQDFNGYYGVCSLCYKSQRIGKTANCPYCKAVMTERRQENEH